MKNLFCAMLAITMLLGCMPGALAQEMVSIAELYDQAQAMGGWWRETFDTPNGQVTVDAPIIVPDVDAMPVITVERAKISEELYEKIIQGKKLGSTDELRYETEMGGDTLEIYLGSEDPYFHGTQTEAKGYDAVSCLNIQRGTCRSNLGIGTGTAEKQAQPTSYHYPWQLDPDQPCLRNIDLTLNDAMEIINKDLELFYPGEGVAFQPSAIKLRGSLLNDATGTGKKFKRDGYMVIESADQLIDGVPIFGPITSLLGSGFHVGHAAGFNEAFDKLIPYDTGNDSVGHHFYGNFTDENNYRLSFELAKKRTVEYADVPLAPLESVLDSIREEMEAGNLRALHSVELGYILYSNPEMTDHAWAIPRWVVNAEYVTKEELKSYEKDKERREEKLKAADPEEYGQFSFYSRSLPVDAQSSEMLIWTVPTKETYEVPKIVTWDEAK